MKPPSNIISTFEDGKHTVPTQKKMRCVGCNRYLRFTRCILKKLTIQGSVGQRFILLLADHPTLHLQAVGASSRSAGKKYKDAVRWKQARPMSADLANLVVRECKASNFSDCDLVFSGLDSDVAGEVGMF